MSGSPVSFYFPMRFCARQTNLQSKSEVYREPIHMPMLSLVIKLCNQHLPHSEVTAKNISKVKVIIKQLNGPPHCNAAVSHTKSQVYNTITICAVADQCSANFNYQTLYTLLFGCSNLKIYTYPLLGWC